MFTIGLDYDDTFSLHPRGWFESLSRLKEFGVEIQGVTARNRYQYIDCPFYLALCDSITYCAGRAKNEVVRGLNIHIDVWVDDHPDRIHQPWPNAPEGVHSNEAFNAINFVKGTHP